MKKLSMFVALLVGSSAAVAQEAAESVRYVIADQHRVAPGKSASDYVAIEKLWQRIHQKQVDAGNMLGWYFFRVENGGRTQFRTVQVFDSLDKRNQPLPQGAWQGVFSDAEGEQLGQTGETRHLLKSELWRSRSRAVSEEPPSSDDVAIVHFIKATPGTVSEYVDMETRLFQKLHQGRIDAGVLKSWFFLSREFPGGHDTDWDFITIQVFPSKKAADKPWPSGIGQKVLTKEEQDSFPDVGALRTIYREEVWHPIARAEPKDD